MSRIKHQFQDEHLFEIKSLFEFTFENQILSQPSSNFYSLVFILFALEKVLGYSIRRNFSLPLFNIKSLYNNAIASTFVNGKFHIAQLATPSISLI